MADLSKQDPGQSETLLKLKSFIRQNLREGSIASSSDGSQSDSEFSKDGGHLHSNNQSNLSQVPSRPLTSSNVTLHDQIWSQSPSAQQDSHINSHNARDYIPVNEGRFQGQHGGHIDGYSDGASSDNSLSSQDTTIQVSEGKSKESEQQIIERIHRYETQTGDTRFSTMNPGEEVSAVTLRRKKTGNQGNKANAINIEGSVSFTYSDPDFGDETDGMDQTDGHFQYYTVEHQSGPSDSDYLPGGEPIPQLAPPRDFSDIPQEPRRKDPYIQEAPQAAAPVLLPAQNVGQVHVQNVGQVPVQDAGEAPVHEDKDDGYGSNDNLSCDTNSSTSSGGTGPASPPEMNVDPRKAPQGGPSGVQNQPGATVKRSNLVNNGSGPEGRSTMKTSKSVRFDLEPPQIKILPRSETFPRVVSNRGEPPSIKTAHGYLNLGKVASFKQMNSSLRSKSSANTVNQAKGGSVQDLLLKLALGDGADDNSENEKDKDREDKLNWQNSKDYRLPVNNNGSGETAYQARSNEVIPYADDNLQTGQREHTINSGPGSNTVYNSDTSERNEKHQEPYKQTGAVNRQGDSDYVYFNQLQEDGYIKNNSAIPTTLHAQGYVKEHSQDNQGQDNKAVDMLFSKMENQNQASPSVYYLPHHPSSSEVTLERSSERVQRSPSPSQNYHSYPLVGYERRSPTLTQGLSQTYSYGQQETVRQNEHQQSTPQDYRNRDSSPVASAPVKQQVAASSFRPPSPLGSDHSGSHASSTRGRTSPSRGRKEHPPSNYRSGSPPGLPLGAEASTFYPDGRRRSLSPVGGGPSGVNLKRRSASPSGRYMVMDPIHMDSSSPLPPSEPPLAPRQGSTSINRKAKYVSSREIFSALQRRSALDKSMAQSREPSGYPSKVMAFPLPASESGSSGRGTPQEMYSARGRANSRGSPSHGYRNDLSPSHGYRGDILPDDYQKEQSVISGNEHKHKGPSSVESQPDSFEHLNHHGVIMRHKPGIDRGGDAFQRPASYNPHGLAQYDTSKRVPSPEYYGQRGNPDRNTFSGFNTKQRSPSPDIQSTNRSKDPKYVTSAELYQMLDAKRQPPQMATHSLGRYSTPDMMERHGGTFPREMENQPISAQTLDSPRRNQDMQQRQVGRRAMRKGQGHNDSPDDSDDSTVPLGRFISKPQSGIIRFPPEGVTPNFIPASAWLAASRDKPHDKPHDQSLDQSYGFRTESHDLSHEQPFNQSYGFKSESHGRSHDRVHDQSHDHPNAMYGNMQASYDSRMESQYHGSNFQPKGPKLIMKAASLESLLL